MADACPKAASDAFNITADVETIAGRTRTKYSLVDVPIDALEASLPDVVPESATPETEEDREYQRFLSSLLPTEPENLSFLDEEDEEYKPEEEEDDHDDEVTRRGISKKELTDLLLDSTHVTFLKVPTAIAAAVPARKSNQDELLNVHNNNDVVLPMVASTNEEVEKQEASGVKQPVKMNFARHMPVSTPAMLRGRTGAVTQAQCIQLASQMHKHLQLLLQTYHLLAHESPSPELATCRAMIEELQQRGKQALEYKNTLLSKLHPAMTSKTGSSLEEGTKASEIPSTKNRSEVESHDGTRSTENLLALRRVTRSLTAAHAAVAHPSMFELVGSQSVDKLTAKFARGCSVEERDRAIQDQMLQLDTHLQAVKKRRKSKKGYSTTEDQLLAHGAKRFGTQASSWEHIQTHFLPTKTTQHLRHRYKYLLRPKVPMNAVKALHFKAQPQHCSKSWLLEEDLRIARGFIEFHKEKYRFACLAKKYLPHRSRLEVRKRWERLEAKFRSDLANLGLSAPAGDLLELAVAMKEYLEDKLRQRMVQQREEAEKAKLDAASQQLGPGLHGKYLAHAVGNSRTGGVDVAPVISSLGSAANKNVDADSCQTKNLHPALFFSSWSFISPATLLNSTCKHNWPSFMDEGTEKKETWQKSRLDDELQLATNDTVGEVDHLDAVSMQDMTKITMPSDLRGALTSNVKLARIPQATLLMDSRMACKESDEEDDDSDYEHDELLSSENDESNSDFEQLEFTDDDGVKEGRDDEISGRRTLEQNTLMPDSDGLSVLSENSLWTCPQSPLTLVDSTTSSLKTHNARCLKKKLSQPGTKHRLRALAALERRMVGKSVATSTTSAKRKGVASLDASFFANGATTTKSGQDDTGAHTRASGVDVTFDNDLWEDVSEDGEFEVVELMSSSDECASVSSDKVNQQTPQDGIDKTLSTSLAATNSRFKTTATGFSLLPNKKPKVQHCPTCCQSRCTCSSSERMQLLLRRMKEKRSSSLLH